MRSPRIGLALTTVLILTGCGAEKLTLDRAQKLCADMQAKAKITDIKWTTHSTYETGGLTVKGTGQDHGQSVAVSCNVAADGTVRSSTSGTPQTRQLG